MGGWDVTLAVHIFCVQRVREEDGLREGHARRQRADLVDVRAVDPVDPHRPGVQVADDQLDLRTRSGRVDPEGVPRAARNLSYGASGRACSSDHTQSCKERPAARTQ